ncbi:MAG: SUMF1/EgtB/PvdO family nonheme iron enzyme [Polyangiaceae bacterium]
MPFHFWISKRRPGLGNFLLLASALAAAVAACGGVEEKPLAREAGPEGPPSPSDAISSGDAGPEGSPSPMAAAPSKDAGPEDSTISTDATARRETGVVEAATPDASSEVFASDDGASLLGAGDGGLADVNPDSTEDVVVADAAEDAPTCPGTVDAGSPPPPSCLSAGAGTTNCGAGGSGCESCCTSLAVPGGTFYRTYTVTDGGVTGEADPATLSGFQLDKYDVTVGRFRRFVAAWNNGSGYLPAQGSGKHTHLNGGKGLEDSEAPGTYETGWQAASWNAYIAPTSSNLACLNSTAFDAWTDVPAGDENQPINCVNWYEAYAFCIWDGGFLPSEAEWEYAAAGGSQQRAYPWGSTSIASFRPDMARQYAIIDEDFIAVGKTTFLAPVGYASLGAGYWGHLDLAGELVEWTMDTFAPYAACTDCADLSSNTGRVTRGDYFSGGGPALLSPSFRSGGNDYSLPPSADVDRDFIVGFRCARAPWMVR